MTEEKDTGAPASGFPEGVVRSRRYISIVWIIPLVAAIIGGWLVYKALSEKGPTITITFKSAEGLQAGKTKIKYKDVAVGVVDSIALSKDLSRVIVTADLVKGSESYLTDKTRFWVVRPRISGGEVSGLGTLFSGAYIAVDPVRNGKRTFSFTGMERPPVVTTDLPGRQFILKADSLGYLDTGSPVYFRQIKVGQVENYELDKDGNAVTIKIFINAPYDQFVLKSSRFWNAGGVNFSLDARGLKVDTESLVSLMIGGIAFTNPVNLESSAPAASGAVFQLYTNQQTALQKGYSIKSYYILNFAGSVRGLSTNAPVEFRGIPIGKVLDINLQVNTDTLAFHIPVLIEIEPERFFENRPVPDKEGRLKFMERLVAKGLRAQLKLGNVLTGQYYVDLDFHPKAPPEKIVMMDNYPKIPTIQTSLDEIFTAITKTLDRINALPLDKIGKDLRVTIQNLNETLNQARVLINNTKNSNIGPQAKATLVQARKTLDTIDRMLRSDSPLNQNANRTMEEVSGAARSIRILMDYLEQNPDSLIYGKGKTQ